jgi:glycerol-3-phosphate acyltransferase PlsY
MVFFSILIALCAYLVGAIPTGYLIAQLKGIADIRKHGSGNIGATNVSRVLGKHYFFIIFLLDAGKAYLFIHAIKHYFDFNYLCIFASIVLFGNGCSIFLRGSGGKGVATLAGLLVALHAPTAILLCGIWLLWVLITHTVGIASVAAALCLPISGYINHNGAFLLFSLFATLWIIYTHRSNIQAYWK